MLSFNLTLVFQMVSFLVFAWLFNRVFFRPIVSHLEARDRYLADQQIQADALLKEAQQLGATHARNLQDARRDAQATVDGALRQAQASRSAQVASAQAEGRERVAQAQAQFTRDRAALVVELQAEVPTLAQAISSKVLAASTLDRADSPQGVQA